MKVKDGKQSPNTMGVADITLVTCNKRSSIGTRLDYFETMCKNKSETLSVI